MILKRILALAALLAAVCSCGILSDQLSAEDQALVQERLDAQSFKVDIEFMLPRRGGQQALTTPYAVTIDNGRIISGLPYIGEAWDLPYGGGKGFTFDAPITEYAEDSSVFGRRVILVATDNEEEILVYRFEIDTNGKVSLRVRSQHRETIDYRGHLDPYTNPAEKRK